MSEIEVKNTMGSPKEYAKFAGIISFVALMSLYFGWGDVMEVMRYFMALYLLVFGAFKLADLTMFAHGFSEYDPIAMRSKLYAKLYPFIEIALGVAFLVNVASPLREIVVIALLGVNAIGVARHLGDKTKIRCACLGKFVNLPLTTISLTEDIAMVVMAAVALIAAF